jgi:hypothetical protein
MLRDQIARLNLAAEGGEEGEPVATHKERYGERKLFSSIVIL